MEYLDTTQVYKVRINFFFNRNTSNNFPNKLRFSNPISTPRKIFESDLQFAYSDFARLNVKYIALRPDNF